MANNYKWLNDKGEKVNHNGWTKAQQVLQDEAEDACGRALDRAIHDDYEDPPNDEGSNTMTNNQEQWIPACDGTETWQRARDGREYMYVWWRNAPAGTPASDRHAWLDRTDTLRHTDPSV